MEYKIAFAGNPNVGKTSLYNRLTKSALHVGNWHGVTVEKISKTIEFNNNSFNISDLPGFYSLTIYSNEESISRDAIYSNDNDVIINVCDANNLQHNLYLTLQLMELGCKVILVANMVDELERKEQTIDTKRLGSILGIPIIKLSCKYDRGIDLLLSEISDFVTNNKSSTPKNNGEVVKNYDALNGYNLPYLKNSKLSKTLSIIKSNLSNSELPNNYLAIKVMENDSFIINELKLSQAQLVQIANLGDLQGDIARLRYEYIEEITTNIIIKLSNSTKKTENKKLAKVINNKKTKKPKDLTQNNLNKIDKFILNKYLALPIFFAIMALVFFITFGSLGKLFSNTLDLAINKLIYTPVGIALASINCPLWVNKLLCDGVIAGVGGVLVFLPQVVLLFFLLSLMEESGYISRVAFMTDGLFQKIGLSGRSVFTMLMGLGCSATAVLTARGLEDDIMRKKTIILTPFFSCSARLPVFTCIVSAFFTGGRTLIIFCMYILGAAVAIALAAIFEKTKKLKSGKQSFIMEMPPYRLPNFERVAQLLKQNSKNFVIKIGTVVFALNIIVWMLSNFSLTGGYINPEITNVLTQKSILEILAGYLAPVFTPLGFGNWRAVTSLLSGLIAKEVVVSSIESLGGVTALFNTQYATISALSFMIFTLLYVPCFATISSIGKEAGAKFALFSVVLQIVVAYICSLVFYQCARLYYSNLGLLVGIVMASIIFITALIVAFKLIRSKNSVLSGCDYCKNSCLNCEIPKKAVKKI